jgi:hypothetical protein
VTFVSLKPLAVRYTKLDGFWFSSFVSIWDGRKRKKVCQE